MLSCARSPKGDKPEWCRPSLVLIAGVLVDVHAQLDLIAEGAGLAELEDAVDMQYLASLGLPEGYLVIFDQRAEAPAWEQRMAVGEAVTAAGRRVMVLRD